MKEFVEQREGSFYLVGSRVPLAFIVDEFMNGEAPEAIRTHYSTLSLEEVYGAITFYLGNQAKAEQDLADRRRIEDEYSKANPTSPEIKEKFERMRQQMLARRS